MKNNLDLFDVRNVTAFVWNKSQPSVCVLNTACRSIGNMTLHMNADVAADQ